MTLRPTSILVLSLAVFATACGGDDEPGGGGECATPCFSPPAAVCDGDSVLAYNPLGTCEDGQCSYAALSPRDCTEDGEICVEGECVVAPTPCDGVICDEPPRPTCDGDSIAGFAQLGECVVVNGDGVCNYDAEVDECRRSETCVDTGDGPDCVRRPCWNIECITPPDRECDGTVIVTYEQEGICDEETEDCSYPEAARVDCADTDQYCLDGRCVDRDPCEDVVCEDIPDAYCDGDVYYAYANAGTCSAGECDYGETTSDCSEVGAICDVDADGCRERRVCEGVVCETPPGPFCDDDTAVTFAASGVCADDDCSYAVTRTDCTATGDICLSGECIAPSACFDVTCEDAPDNFCRGSVAVRYANPGDCDDGICRYTESEEDCADSGRECFAGDCELDDPCIGVVCNTPPAPFCDDTLAVTFSLPGECVGGDCRYVEFEEECTDDGGRCVAGDCVAPDSCVGVVCDDPPEAFCAGDVQVSYPGVAVCTAGECDYDAVESEYDCEDEEGLRCWDGACVPAGRALPAGAMVITEIMVESEDAASRAWFEVHFPGGGDISGMQVRNLDGAGFTVPTDTLVGEYVLFGASEDAVPDGVDVVWPSGFSLSTVDRITLLGGDTVDEVAWNISEGWDFAPGIALSLDAAALAEGDNDDPADWCQGIVEFSASRYGTPGEANGACSSDLVEGDLVISEIMVDGEPRPGGIEQWFEVYNASGTVLDISGLRVASDSGAFAVAPATSVPSGSYFVFGVDGTVAGGPDYEYGLDLIFDPDGDSLTLSMGDTIVDAVDFGTGAAGGWPYTDNATMELISTPLDNAVPGNWCRSDGSYPGFALNFGTPGDSAVCD